MSLGCNFRRALQSLQTAQVQSALSVQALQNNDSPIAQISEKVILNAIGGRVVVFLAVTRTVLIEVIRPYK